MLFNNLFFPSNRIKEKQIQQLEQQLISLFENHHIAWNNFCKVSKIEDYVPTLKKSIKENSVEDCIKEIDYATTILENTITNITDKLDLQLLFEKCNYKIQSLESDLLKKVINYLPITIGGLSGIGISAYIFHRVLLKQHIFNNCMTHISNIYNTEINSLISTLIPSQTSSIASWNSLKQELFSSCDTSIQQMYVKFLVNIQNSTIATSDKAIMTNLFKNTIANNCVQTHQLINSQLSTLKPVSTSFTELSAVTSSPKLLLSDADTILNVMNNNFNLSLDLDHTFINSDNLFQLDSIILNKKHSPMFYLSSSIIGIGIIATIIILLDVLISSIEAFIQSKLLNIKFAQITNILTELTTLMTKETISLIHLTSNIQDGILYFDKEHMVLVDNNNNLKLVTLKD
ncbi:MAG: hypothetical protein ACRCSG_01935 [Cellulosilyticaceae bacterium]